MAGIKTDTDLRRFGVRLDLIWFVQRLDKSVKIYASVNGL